MDMTATGMTLISDPTTPPGGVSATTGAVGSGGGASLCTGLGFEVGGGLGFDTAGGTQSAAVEGAACESAGGCVVAGGVSVLSAVAGGGIGRSRLFERGIGSRPRLASQAAARGQQRNRHQPRQHTRGAQLSRPHPNLAIVHAAVNPACAQQTPWRTVLDDTASVEHDNTIEGIEGRQAMRDGYDRSTLE